MEKNLLFSLDHLIWVRLNKGGYESERIIYREQIKEIKFLGIVLQKLKPACFIDTHSLDSCEINIEDFKNKYYISKSKVLTVKPHLRLKFQDGTYYEEFFDSLEEAEEVFKMINNKLYPEILLCN